MTREPDPSQDEDADEAEVVDGLPVLAADLDAEPAPRAPAVAAPEHLPAFVPVPARQVAALAVSGFVAGAATVAMVHRRRSRVVTRRAGRRRKPAARTPLGEVISSSSFLVDVHLLRRD